MEVLKYSIIKMAKITEITKYKGRWCAAMDDGRFYLSNGSMELLLCEKVPQGMKVLEANIIGGIMMRTEADFRWCVENLNGPTTARM